VTRTSAPSAATRPATGTSIVFAFQPNDTAVFQTQRVLEGFVTDGAATRVPFEVDVTQVQSQSVSRVAPDGSGTLDLADSTWGSYNGQSLSAVAGKVVEETPLTIAPNGQVLRGGVVPVPQAIAMLVAAPGTDVFLPLLPDHPVSPGDTWMDAYTRPYPLSGGGSLGYRVQGRLLRFTTLGATRAELIESIGLVPFDVTLRLRDLASLDPSLGAAAPTAANARYRLQGTLEYSLLTWIDRDAGHLLQSRVAGRLTMTLSAQDAGAAQDGQSLSFSAALSARTQRVPVPPLVPQA
jgi:hypothetical protein